jgi:1,4-alpha-glucan branching enzyme
MRDLIRDLNAIYRDEPALWEVDFSHEGFLWLEPNDAMNNVFAFMRSSRDGERQLVCIANLSPVPREGYRVGLPRAGEWREVLNTDSTYYAGGGIGNMGAVTAEERGWHEQPYSASLTLPPLSVLWLRPS